MNKLSDIAAGAGPQSGDAPRRRSGRAARRLFRLGLVVLVIGAFAVFGTRWAVARWSHVSTSDARIAASMVTVSSEVSGRVLTVPVTGGETVTKGAALVSIDPEAAQYEVAATEAQLDGLDAKAAQLRAQQDMVRASIKSRRTAARAGISAAEARHQADLAKVRAAQSHFDRITALASRKVASEQDKEDARTALDTAQEQERASAAEVETARANLAVIDADAEQIKVLDRQIAAIASDRAQLQAQRSEQRVDLSRRTVTAAFDGVVDATFVDPGEYVTPGTRMLIYHRPHEVWVEANVKETEFRRLALGAPATITVDAYAGRSFHGTVERLGGAATSQFALLPSPNPSGNFTKVTQRLPIRVSIDAGDAVLSPGMMVELSIDVAD